jgi:hypothetical protein
MTSLTKWAADVHAFCLRHDRAMTEGECIRFCGIPASQTPARDLLDSACAAGHFRRQCIVEDGRATVRYRAVVREPAPRRMPDNTNSWFHGIRRVSSVFDLGAEQ